MKTMITLFLSVVLLAGCGTIFPGGFDPSIITEGGDGGDGGTGNPGTVGSVENLSLENTGPFGCRVTFDPTTNNLEYAQVQRRLSGGSYPTLDENADRGWSNFIPVPMKARHFSDLLCSHGQTYDYQIRFVSIDPLDNSLDYGDWSEISVTIPSYTETLIDLDNDYTGPYGARLQQAFDDARLITEASSNAFVRILVGEGVHDIEGTEDSNGHVLHLSEGNYRRISLEGNGKGSTVFNFKVVGGLDPEDNFLTNFNVFELQTDQVLVQNREYHTNEAEVWRPTDVVSTSPSSSNDFPTGQSGTSPWVDTKGNTWEWVWTPTAQQIGGRGSFLNSDRYHSHNWLRFKDLTISGGTRPTGYVWQYDLSGLKRGWDQTHKGFSMGFANDGADFWLWDSCEVINWRGECIYSGTLNGGSAWIVNTDTGLCNSSAISMSADMVILGGTIKDAANSGNESALTFEFGSSNKRQNCVMADVEIVGQDYWLVPGNNPILVGNPEARHALAVFGQPNTGIFFDRLDISNTTITGCLQRYEQRNVYLGNSTLTNCVTSGNIADSYWKSSIQAQSSYQLVGGMDNVVMRNNVFHRTNSIGESYQCKSYINLSTPFDLPMENIYLLGNTFSSNSLGHPQSVFSIQYSRYDDDPARYLGLTVAHNIESWTSTSRDPENRWKGDGGETAFYGMAHQYSNSWDEDTSELPPLAQLIWPGGSANYSVYVMDTLLKGHTFSNSNGTNVNLRYESLYNIPDGQRVTIFGSWTGYVTRFQASSASYSGLPGGTDLELADETEWAIFEYDAGTLKWTYVSRGSI